MGTITKPGAEKRTSAWWLIAPVLAVGLLVFFFVARENARSAIASGARSTRATAADGPAVIPPDVYDENGARAVVEAYFAAASVSDFEKMAVLTGGDTSHPIVGSYKLLRNEGCKAETGLSQDMRPRWSVLHGEIKIQESSRALSESIPGWKSLPPSADLAQLRGERPLLVDTALGGAGGAEIFSPQFFSTDGPFRIEGCTFLIDAEFQSKAGTRLWKRQHVTAIHATSAAKQESPWLVGPRQDVGGA